MHDITQGHLTVDGTDVMTLHGKNLRKFRRRIGMIFQSFNLITPHHCYQECAHRLCP